MTVDWQGTDSPDAVDHQVYLDYQARQGTTPEALRNQIDFVEKDMIYRVKCLTELMRRHTKKIKWLYTSVVLLGLVQVSWMLFMTSLAL